MVELKIILPPGAEGILAAVSGGADSVAMLALLKEAAEEQSVSLTAAHFEHGIRGETSRADAAFVRDLCRSWNIPLIEGSADVPAFAKACSMGIEEAAREARYAFLRKARNDVGADYIALAHHRDDQVETVLMHLMRGCGLRGLVGMRVLEGDIFRPLLNCPKENLVCFLRERQIQWREDETNSIPDTPRNGLRLEVIPAMERFYPGMRRAVKRISEIAAEEDGYMEAETSLFLDRRKVIFPGGCLIELNREDGIHPAIMRRAIHRLTGCSYESAKRAVGLCGTVRGAAELESGWRAEKGIKGLYLLNGKWQGLEESALEAGSLRELNGLGVLHVGPGLGIPVRDDPFCQELDADALKGAVIRTRREGDVIRPLGSSGSQKLKEYFINRHVDRPLRDRIPLVAVGKEVMWVMGEGISENARLREGSRAVRLELTGWPLQKNGGKNNA